jgi:hypothetical protein
MRFSFNYPLVLVLLASRAVFAQVSGGIDVVGGYGRFDAKPWATASQLAASLTGVYRAGYLRLDGSAANQNGWTGAGAVDGALSSPAVGRFRATLAGRYQSGGITSVRSLPPEALLAVSAKFGTSGYWAGVARGLNRAANAVPLSTEVGAWRSLGAATVSLSSRSVVARVGYRPSTLGERMRVDSVFTDTTGWRRYTWKEQTGDSGSAGFLRRWTDIEARIAWSVKSLRLGAALSARPTQDLVRGGVWGRGEAEIRVMPRTYLALTAGTSPLTSAVHSTGRFATIGLRFSGARSSTPAMSPAVRPDATAFRAQPLGNGVYRLALRVPNARAVEVSGDFTEWKAVSLREVSPNVWEATLPLKPGTHRINVRVDGDRWTAVPGLPSVEDDFNGRVSLLVIQ